MPLLDESESPNVVVERQQLLTQRVSPLAPLSTGSDDTETSSAEEVATPSSASKLKASEFSLAMARRSKYTFYMWLLLAFCCGIGFQRTLLTPTAAKKPRRPTLLQFATASDSPPITYGHVHMAKTGGTTLNGELAVKYERVCGHKGYSYDAIRQNLRVMSIQKRLRKKGAGLYQLKDSMSAVKEGYNRGRVPPQVMWEIGLHDCDWISIEDPGWKAWQDHVRSAVQYLELHVPCRDPIDHMLSMCNYKSIKFQCAPYEQQDDNQHHRHLDSFRSRPGPVHMVRTRRKPKKSPKTNMTLESQIDSCMLGIRRFDYNLTQVADSIKCFDYSQQSKYMEWMDQRLQKRRVTADYVYRSSDTKRHEERECLPKASKRLKERVRKYLIDNYDYYHFCTQCMGGDQDLFA